MVRFLRRPAALARLTLAPFVSLFLMAGCGDDSTGPDGPAAIDVTLTADVTTAKPGERVIVTLTAAPRNGARVTELELAPLGIVAGDRAVFVGASPSRNAVAAKDTFYMPATVGSAKFVGIARGTNGVAGESDTLRVTVADATPPVIDSVRLTHPDGVNQGDSVSVVIGAHDDAVLTQVIVQWTGAVQRSDTVRYAAAEVTGHVAGLRLAADADVRAPLGITVKVVDAGGNEATSALTEIRVRDVTPPAIVPFVLPCPPGVPNPCIPGDTVRFTITASDDHELSWIGYRLGAPSSRGDSVRTIVEDGDLAASFVIARSMIGVSSFTVFARDSSGNETTLTSTLWVYDAVRHPTTTIALSTAPFDVAYDSLRGRLWISQPGESRLAVYGLDGALQATIVMPFAPAGLDIGGGAMADTLVVALRGTGRVALVSLATAVPQVDTLRVASDASLEGRGLQSLRLLAGNRVAAVLSAPELPPQLLVYDLGARAEVARPALAGADAGAAPRLARPANRSRTLVWDAQRSGVGPQPLAWSVDAGTAAVTGPVQLFSALRNTNASLSADGATSFVGGERLSAALVSQGAWQASGSSPRASVVTPDGTEVFLHTSCCSVPEHVERQRVATREVLERFFLPSLPSNMMLLNDAGILVAWSNSAMYLVRLDEP